MSSIRKFLDFCLYENALQVTSDWYVSTNGQELTKRDNNGYLLLTNESLSIIYKIKSGKESRIDFLKSGNNEGSIKTSVIEESGKTEKDNVYNDLNIQNILSIIIDFISGTDPEEMEKYSLDRMILGFAKTIIAFSKTEYIDQCPGSYKTFIKLLKNISSSNIEKSNSDDPVIAESIKKFMAQVRNHL